MEIVIDIDDSVPSWAARWTPGPTTASLFAQLVGQIKRAVLSDKMCPGDALPSIRQLANDLELDDKTVAKAYRVLEGDSVIQTTRCRGTFVHPDAMANSVPRRFASGDAR